MAAFLPDGATIAIGTTYASAKTITAISNASEGVVSAAAHGYSAGDILRLTSGWSRLNDKVVRVKSPTTDAFTLEGVDTSSTSLFPAGQGVGEAVKVTAYSQIQQIVDNQFTRGQQNTVNYSFLEDEDEHEIQTTRSPSSLVMQIAHSAALSASLYPILEAPSIDKNPRVFQVSLPQGDFLYYHARASFDPVPTLSKGAIMQVQLDLRFVSRPSYFAS